MSESLFPSSWPYWRLVKHQLWTTAFVLVAAACLRVVQLEVVANIGLVLMLILSVGMVRWGMPVIAAYCAAVGPLCVIEIFPLSVPFFTFLLVVVLLWLAIIVSSERIEMALSQTYILLLAQTGLVVWFVY